jgi:hypothetical protein
MAPECPFWYVLRFLVIERGNKHTWTGISVLSPRQPGRRTAGSLPSALASRRLIRCEITLYVIKRGSDHGKVQGGEKSMLRRHVVESQQKAVRSKGDKIDLRFPDISAFYKIALGRSACKRSSCLLPSSKWPMISNRLPKSRKGFPID